MGLLDALNKVFDVFDWVDDPIDAGLTSVERHARRSAKSPTPAETSAPETVVGTAAPATPVGTAVPPTSAPTPDINAQQTAAPDPQETAR
jgi:hypothetical protein